MFPASHTTIIFYTQLSQLRNTRSCLLSSALLLHNSMAIHSLIPPSPTSLRLRDAADLSPASDDFVRCASEPAPPRPRHLSTASQHARRGSMPAPREESLFSPRDEAAHPRASFLSLALNNFHPSLEWDPLSSQPLRTNNPSSRRSPGTVAAKSFPSLRTAPSCAPPVCLIPPRGRRAGARLKMPKLSQI